MNSNKIVNLANPTSDQDAATRNYVNTSIPIGGIIMWSGNGVTLPSNWKLCDGQTYGSVTTPDLRSRVVMGVSSVGVSRLENKSVGFGDTSKLGNDISGVNQGEWSGYSVSLSADGMTVAIGGNANNSSTGITRIYKYDVPNEKWLLFGPSIPGVDAGENSGYSVSLSADGMTVAIGAYRNNSNTGITRIYKYEPTTKTWPLFGQTIPGGNVGENSGVSVSLSADGTTVAVGAPNNSSNTGITRIYKYNATTNTWPLFGQTIPGVDAGEKSGISVSLSADGTTVAVGAPNNSSGKGITRVYKLTGNVWTRLGTTDISGVDVSEYSGYSVSLSADGTTVAIGAFGNNSNTGITRIYKYNGSAWPLFGPTIPGGDAREPTGGLSVREQSGYSVSLSADGMTVAIGAWANNSFKGITRIYKYDVPTNTWLLFGPMILGVNAEEQSGWSVSLSADGTTVAIGAYANSSLRGITRVYSLVNPNIYGLAFIMRVS